MRFLPRQPHTLESVARGTPSAQRLPRTHIATLTLAHAILTVALRSCSLVLGTAYPIYSSFALLESTAPAKERETEAAQWLTYWAVYGVLSAAEQMFVTRPPLYYHLKLALLFWLQSSKYQVRADSRVVLIGRQAVQIANNR